MSTRRPRMPMMVIATVFAAMPLSARGDASGSGGVPAKARTLAERGRAYHDAGDYAAAINAFTQAYVMAPSPALLFNLAQAYRLQGDCDDAALMYRRYLATNPSSEERALAESHLANVERCIHKLALHIPVEVAPGRPAVSAPADPLAAAKTAPARSRRAEITRDIGAGLMVGGGVALAVAGYYTVRAHDAATEVASAYAMGAPWRDIAPIDERGRSAASAARLFGAGGAVGVAGGLVTYLVGRRLEAPVMVTPKSHGVELNILWAF